MIDILIFASHSDDEIVGMGSSLIKYAREGNKILTIIFSYGEKSHPHLKEKVIAKEREKETKKIDKILKRKSIFLGLNENRILDEVDSKVKNKIKNIIKKEKPKKIFLTSATDPHPDHRAVNKVIIPILDEIKYKGDVYTYEVWNFIEENNPKVYIDVSNEFKEKLNLLKQFKSQRASIYPLWLPIYVRAWLYGRRNNYRFAEKFYKIR